MHSFNLGHVKKHFSGKRLQTNDGKRSLRLESLESRQMLTGVPVISEFMAINNTVSEDEDGIFSDWIEIHNPDPDPLSLNGWHLTDNESLLTRWAFPDVTLAANEYLLVRASGQNRLGTGLNGEYHTNFSLSGGGEYLALVHPDGEAIAQEFVSSGGEYPQQTADVSYGLDPASSEETYFLTPTPGAVNSSNTTANPSEQIVITEIMFHPSSAIDPPSENPAHEFIELFNNGLQNVDLSGWQFTRGVDFTFPTDPGVNVMAPGDYLVVAADLTTFNARYSGVANVISGWAGQLSNSGEEILLRNSLGNRIDRVTYADQGDWAVRELGPLDFGNRGWTWSDDTDGGGKSLELINLDLSNRQGQNWSASATDGGTPGAINSINADVVAPLILDVEHFPAIPGINDPVTITAQLRVEAGDSVTVSIFYRLDRAGNTDSFLEVPMADDGLSGDGAVGDTIYGGQIPAQANGAIVEFYVRAEDTAGNIRTWPAEVDVDGTLEQSANALYQVNNSFTGVRGPGDQSLFFLIMTEDERARLAVIGDSEDSANDDLSDAQMNGTFISFDGDTTRVRYQTGIRNRGHGSRSIPPMNYRVNFPSDASWSGATAINLNSKYTPSQVVGMKVFQAAMLAAPDAAPVQILVNGQDLSESGGRMFGAYAYVEALNSEWAENHFASDGGGNLYRGVRIPGVTEADLRYLGTDATPYREAYRKSTNSSVDDWSDLIAMTDALNNSSPATYVADISPHVNIGQWVSYMAVDTLLGNRESGLNTGVGDDYAMYRGVDDPRFTLVPHDMDTIFGEGNSGSSPTQSIFNFENVDGLSTFMNHSDIVPLYYAALLQHAATIFAPEEVGRLIDQLLGDVDGDGTSQWVPLEEGTIQDMKAFAEGRRQHVLGLIPQQLTVESSLPIEPVAGRYRVTTDSTISLNGESHAARTRSVTVAGVAANWDARNATWSAPNMALNPGVNRLFVQSFDGPNGTGNLLQATYLDVWYDTGVGGGSTTPLIDVGSAWSYLADGSDQGVIGLGTNWFADPGYDDSSWVQPNDAGNNGGEYGYGDGDETTVIVCGPSAPDCSSQDDNYITTFFRKDFTIAPGDAAQFVSLNVQLKRDDGAAVYINGTPVVLDNIAGILGDPILSSIGAAGTISNENAFDATTIDLTSPQFSGLIHDGVNVIAVEIHQASPASSDISFDLSLTASKEVAPGELTPLSGTLPGDTTLTVAGGPYHVTSDVTVPAGTTLTIEPGVNVYFSPGTRLTIGGILSAIGTEYQRIRLTSLPGEALVSDIRPELPNGPAKWGGIQFVNSNSDQNILSYVDIEYAQSSGGSVGLTGSEAIVDNMSFFGTRLRMVRTTSSSIIIRNSVFPDMFLSNESPRLMTPSLDNVSEQVKGSGGIPSGGHYIIEGNVFGTNKGHNDVIDIDSNQRPNPILVIRNNVFMGAGDEAIDGGGDILIEGNLFMNFIKDLANNGTGDSNVISTGDTSNTVLMVARNTFVNNDHVVNFKNGAYGFLENNTIIDITQSHLSLATDTPIRPVAFSAINFLIPHESDPQNSVPRDPPGLGAYTSGNIYVNLPAMPNDPPGAFDTTVFGYPDFVNPNINPPAGHPANLLLQLLEVHNSLVTDAHAFSNLNASPASGRSFDFLFEDARIIDPSSGNFALGLGSPALGTGPNGLDMGSQVAIGASISGEPSALTSSTDATLTIGGPGILRYQWRLDGGPWSETIDITLHNADGSVTITTAPQMVDPTEKVRTAELQLTGLSDGIHTVEVRGENFAGELQSEADATVSKSWEVNSTLSRVRINEVLASNIQAFDLDGTSPDLIELVNDGVTTIVLTGMSISDDVGNPGKFVFPAGASISPGEHLVLVADDSPVVPVPDQIYLGFRLGASTGEGVFLYDTAANGSTLLDSVEFGIQIPDMSIGRVGHDGNWALTQPTFGAANIAQRTGDPNGLVVNEWFASGQYQLGDRTFTNDFIELYNTDVLPVALGGLYLTDDPATQQDKHQIAALSFISGLGWQTFIADNDEQDGANHVNFQLATENGWITLFATDLTKIDTVFYGPQTSDVSQGRLPDGGSNYAFFTQPTPSIDSSPPSVPSGLSLTSVTDTQVDFQWNASTDEQSGVAAYRIYRNGVQIATTTETSYSDTAIIPGGVYSYRVSAVNGDGIESDLSTAIGSSLDTSPPSIPTDLTGTVVGASRIDLFWTASVDSETGVQFYTILRDGAEIGTSTSTTFVDSTFTAGDSVFYQITATNNDNVTSGTSSQWHVVAMQQGVSPSTAYDGNADTWLNEDSVDENNGSDILVGIDGDHNNGLESLGLIR